MAVNQIEQDSPDYVEPPAERTPFKQVDQIDVKPGV